VVVAYDPATDIALFANSLFLTYFVGDQPPGESIPISTYDGMGRPVSIWPKPGAPGTFGIVDDREDWWEATVSPDGWEYGVLWGSRQNQDLWWNAGGSPYDGGPLLGQADYSGTQLIDPDSGAVLSDMTDATYYLSSGMAFARCGDKRFLGFGHLGPMQGTSDYMHRIWDVDYSTSPPTCVATDCLTPFSPQPDTLQVGSASVAARVGKIVAASCTVDSATGSSYSLVVWSLTYPFGDVVVTPIDTDLSTPGLDATPLEPNVKFAG
jgi:hypothetical protein